MRKDEGNDGVQGFWLKDLNGLDNRIPEQFNETIRAGVVPTWMATGRTPLRAKEILKDNAVDSYKPISRLPPMWKVFTGIAAHQIYK